MVGVYPGKKAPFAGLWTQNGEWVFAPGWAYPRVASPPKLYGNISNIIILVLAVWYICSLLGMPWFHSGGAEQLSQQDARTPVSQARGSTNQTPSTHGVPRQASVTQKAAAGVGKSPHTQKATAPGKPSKADDSSTKEHFSGLHLL